VTFLPHPLLNLIRYSRYIRDDEQSVGFETKCGCLCGTHRTRVLEESR
jgi:hypothetical protein